MPVFKDARSYVEYRVFVQRLDSLGRTWFEVVDRFTVGEHVIGEYDDEDSANAVCAAIRIERTAMVERNPLTYGGQLR